MAHIRQSGPDSGLGFQAESYPLSVHGDEHPVFALQVPQLMRDNLIEAPLFRERGTCKTVKARFWPWLSGRELSTQCGPLSVHLT